MGTPDDVKKARDLGLAYCDQAAQALEQGLGHPPDLEEIATFYAAASGSMQGLVAALVHEMAGAAEAKTWLGDVAAIVQGVLRDKNCPIEVQATPAAPAEAAAAPLPEEEPTAEGGNGHPEPEGPTDPACTCFNKKGMCVVCLEGLSPKLKNAAAWVAAVQELDGCLKAECAACTPRILDRAVAQAIRKNVQQVGEENRSKILSAVVSALPQLTGLEAWPETTKVVAQLCPSLVESGGE